MEVGKDIIAKRQGEVGTAEQWCFQLKAGNISTKPWRDVRGQIDELRTSDLSHPSFDTAIPRRAVLVLTGRLTGNAPVLAQEYRSQLAEHKELDFETWDRETLLEMLIVHPEAAVAATQGAPFVQLLGQINAGQISDRVVERYSRSWIATPGKTLDSNPVLECAVLANRLRDQNRIDLACIVALAAIRAAWANGHGDDPPTEETLAAADAAKRLFVAYGQEFIELMEDPVFDPDSLITGHRELGAYVTYPVRCLRAIELLSLFGLAVDEQEHRQRITDTVARFVENQPGCVHPISDRWAVSLIPPLLLLAADDRLEAEVLLHGVIRWIGTCYEERLGLGAADASPRDEIDYLIDGGMEHIELTKRNESLVAAVVLDLATAAEFGDTYDLARNDFLAANAYPQVFHVADEVDQYLVDGSFSNEINPPYADGWGSRTGSTTAPHQDVADEPVYLLRIGRPWDLLAIQSVIRNRYFFEVLRSYLQ